MSISSTTSLTSIPSARSFNRTCLDEPLHILPNAINQVILSQPSMSNCTDIVASITFSELLAAQPPDTPVLIVFLRRFGCGASRLTAMRVRRLAPLLAQRHIPAIAIGSDAYGYGAFIRKYWPPNWPVFIDAAGKCFDLLGFKRIGFSNALGLMTPKLMDATKGLIKSFCRTKNFRGEWHHLGGVVVLDVDLHHVRYMRREQYPGDVPDLDDVLKAIILD